MGIKGLMSYVIRNKSSCSEPKYVIWYFALMDLLFLFKISWFIFIFSILYCYDFYLWFGLTRKQNERFEAILDGSAFRYLLFHHLKNIMADSCVRTVESRVIQFIRNLKTMNLILKVVIFDAIIEESKSETILQRRKVKMNETVQNYKEFDKITSFERISRLFMLID